MNSTYDYSTLRHASDEELNSTFEALNNTDKQVALTLLVNKKKQEEQQAAQKQEETIRRSEEWMEHLDEVNRLFDMIYEAQQHARVRKINPKQAYWALRDAEDNLLRTVKTKAAAEGCKVIIDLNPEARPTGYYHGHYNVKQSTQIEAEYKRGRLRATRIVRRPALQGWSSTVCVYTYTNKAQQNILNDARIGTVTVR